MKKVETYPIDIVVPWVDGNDPAWRKERNKYAEMEGIPSVIDNSETRFRDWDTLKYLFRSIEQNAPWVRKVHFVTCGHLPEWLNTKCKKLHIVNHKDYLDPAYLPTFSSHTIELGMHRIPGLAEHFIYFNDDILILKPTKRTDFFYKGLPRDYAVLNVISSSHRGSAMDTALTDIEIINEHFKKNQVIKQNFLKWFTPVYGIGLMRTLLLMPWPIFTNLYGTHVCNPFLKSTFKEVWEKEGETLHATCMHKFRTRRDVNQWLMREWQLCQGKFIPADPFDGRLLSIKNDNRDIREALEKKKYKYVCINDNGAEEILDFKAVYDELQQMMEQQFPCKSSFEL